MDRVIVLFPYPHLMPSVRRRSGPMRRWIIAFLAIVTFGLVFCALWPFETRLSSADKQAITAEIRKQTSEPILSIHPLTRGRVEVKTGKVFGRLDGCGQHFYLKRHWREWRIYDTYVWIS